MSRPTRLLRGPALRAVLTAILALWVVACGGRTAPNEILRADAGPDSVAFSPSNSAISIGSERGCMVSREGTLRCWELGATIFDTPVTGRGWVDVQVGEGHACALRNDGVSECWLSQGRSFAGVDFVGAPLQLQALAVGDFYGACGATVDGEFVSWVDEVLPPFRPEPTDVTDVSYGYIDACVIHSGGRLRCTDFNPASANTPRGSFRQVESGQYVHCALDDAGAAHCWGRLGSNRIVDVPEPIRIAGGPFIDIDVGLHMCGVTTEGALACAPLIDIALPFAVPPGIFVAVSTNGNYACALSPDDDIVCFGERE